MPSCILDQGDGGSTALISIVIWVLSRHSTRSNCLREYWKLSPYKLLHHADGMTAAAFHITHSRPEQSFLHPDSLACSHCDADYPDLPSLTPSSPI